MSSRPSSSSQNHHALFVLALAGTSSGQLSTGFYSSSCPCVYNVVKSVAQSAIAKGKRINGRHHHSALLPCTITLSRAATRRCCWITRPASRERKWRRPTAVSVRGLEVIDAIKSPIPR
ncbi:unnamed protein product [Urochloa humidicola]